MVRLEVFSLYSPSLVSPFIRLQIVVRGVRAREFSSYPSNTSLVSLYTKHRYTTVERLRSTILQSFGQDQTGAREAHFEKQERDRKVVER